MIFRRKATPQAVSAEPGDIIQGADSAALVDDDIFNSQIGCMERNRKARQDRADTELKAFQELDERERVAALDWSPDPEVTTRVAKIGTLLCIEGLELPAQYIAEIKPPFPPKGPSIEYLFGPYASIGQASIQITMLSGATYQIKTNRWKIDALLALLLTVWKANR